MKRMTFVLRKKQDMKTLLLILTIAISFTTIAKPKDDKSPIIGSWKFSKQSISNEFQKVFRNTDYQTEYFTFAPNHTFSHQFVDKDGNIVKSLQGKWNSTGGKINILYSDIDYNLNMTYFFLDKDLVLGQNFSHVIFTKDNTDVNTAMN